MDHRKRRNKQWLRDLIDSIPVFWDPEHPNRLCTITQQCSVTPNVKCEGLGGLGTGTVYAFSYVGTCETHNCAYACATNACELAPPTPCNGDISTECGGGTQVTEWTFTGRLSSHHGGCDNISDYHRCYCECSAIGYYDKEDPPGTKVCTTFDPV
jgi:hypothetical protein